MECKPKHARIKIVPGNTIYKIVDQNTLAFRFQLDKAYLGIDAAEGQTPIFTGENCL